MQHTVHRVQKQAREEFEQSLMIWNKPPHQMNGCYASQSWVCSLASKATREGKIREEGEVKREVEPMNYELHLLVWGFDKTTRWYQKLRRMHTFITSNLVKPDAKLK